MNVESKFGHKAIEVLHNLQRAVSPAADDYGFDVELDSGALTLLFDKPKSKIVVSAHVPTGQVWISDGAKNQKLDWDIVENTFVLGSTGQTLKEVLEAAISARVDDDVSL
jgi:iron donor protein CyaY